MLSRPPFVALLLVLAFTTPASTAFAQPTRCKAPKELYQGACRYADEITKLKRAAAAKAKPKPIPRPKPLPRPKPKPAVAPAPTAEPATIPAPAPKPAASAAPAPAPPAPAPPAPAPLAPVSPEPPVLPSSASTADNTNSTGLGWQRVTALALGGVAVIGAAVGTGAVVSAESSYRDSEPACPDNVCTAQGHRDRESAFAKASTANVALAVAGVAAAGGIVFWLIAPSPADDGSNLTGSATVPSRLSATLSPRMNGANFSVRATW